MTKYLYRVNIEWKTILGYSRDELKGRPFMELIHPDDVAATIAEMASLEKGITTFYFENRYLYKNGPYRLLAWSAIASVEDQMIHAVASDIKAAAIGIKGFLMKPIIRSEIARMTRKVLDESNTES